MKLIIFIHVMLLSMSAISSSAVALTRKGTFKTLDLSVEQDEWFSRYNQIKQLNPVPVDSNSEISLRTEHDFTYLLMHNYCKFTTTFKQLMIKQS